jgi:hypothetical protein
MKPSGDKQKQKYLEKSPLLLGNSSNSFFSPAEESVEISHASIKISTQEDKVDLQRFTSSEVGLSEDNYVTAYANAVNVHNVMLEINLKFSNNELSESEKNNAMSNLLWLVVFKLSFDADKLVATLLNNGAVPDVFLQWSALMESINKGYHGTMKNLIERGADLEYKINVDNPPIQYVENDIACYQGIKGSE